MGRSFWKTEKEYPGNKPLTCFEYNGKYFFSILPEDEDFDPMKILISESYFVDKKLEKLGYMKVQDMEQKNLISRKKKWEWYLIIVIGFENVKLESLIKQWLLPLQFGYPVIFYQRASALFLSQNLELETNGVTIVGEQLTIAKCFIL